MVSENELNDILLLNLLKADDEKAFKYIFDRYFSPLCRFMYLYVKNQQEVEEMALDIFTYVWENRATLEIKLTFKAYLFQAARNKCLNNIRDRKNTCSIEESGYDAYLGGGFEFAGEMWRSFSEKSGGTFVKFGNCQRNADFGKNCRGTDNQGFEDDKEIPW